MKHGEVFPHALGLFFTQISRRLTPAVALPVTLGGAILFLLFGILYLFESFAEFRNPAPLPPSL